MIIARGKQSAKPDTVSGLLDEFNVTSGNATTKRSSVIEYFFNGNGLPSNDTPESITTSYTGTMHGANTSNLSGFSSVTRLKFDTVDGDTETWSSYYYHIFNSSPNGILVINHRGHGSEGATTHENMMNSLLAAGYDILFCAMPLSDPDTGGENTTTNLSASAGHEALFADGIDDVSYNAHELFVSPQVRALNYMDSNFSYSDYYSVGLSGGGWTVAVLSAIDTRISKTISVRGISPRSLKIYPYIPSGFENDFEQGGAVGVYAKCGEKVYNQFSDDTYIDIVSLCIHSGRKFVLIRHINDPATPLNGYSPNWWYYKMLAKATELSGEYVLYLNEDSSEKSHIYQTSEIARTITEFT